MKILVTGGGTGGHVYPALEVARELIRAGAEVEYWGSQRGQEGLACDRSGISFRGYPSQPLYKVASVRGVKGALNLARAMIMVRRDMQRSGARAVFSTGGYASAPVVGAARKLGIPYVIHEQNVVPGRTNRILGRHAECVCTVFRNGASHFETKRIERTGMPVRPEFRSGQPSLGLASTMPSEIPLLLVMGGSQGAQSINEAALATAVRMARTHVQWLHVAGPKHYDGMGASLAKLAVTANYELKAFLEASEMASAMMTCDLAICRSGAGTLAELAAARKPSILIPYPHAFGDHQVHNAREFVDMGAADLLDEPNLQPSTLEARILGWMNEPDRLAAAQNALAEWDQPHAAQRIAEIVGDAANRA